MDHDRQTGEVPLPGFYSHHYKGLLSKNHIVAHCFRPLLMIAQNLKTQRAKKSF